jgi:hypothetical protein
MALARGNSQGLWHLRRFCQGSSRYLSAHRTSESERERPAPVNRGVEFSDLKRSPVLPFEWLGADERHSLDNTPQSLAHRFWSSSFESAREESSNFQTRPCLGFSAAPQPGSSLSPLKREQFFRRSAALGPCSRGLQEAVWFSTTSDSAGVSAGSEEEFPGLREPSPSSSDLTPIWRALTNRLGHGCWHGLASGKTISHLWYLPNLDVILCSW